MGLTFNGRPFRAGDFERAIEKAVREKLPEVARRQLESVRCPVHGRSARVHPQGTDRVTVSDFCCEKLKQEIERHLS